MVGSGPDIWYPGLVALGLATGVMTGLLGIGGGFILTPALRVLFDIPYPLAIGSSLLQIMVTTALSSYGHWRRGNIDLKLGAVMGAGGLVGVEGGVRVLQTLTLAGTAIVGGRPVAYLDLVLNLCFLALLVAVAVFMLRESLDNRGGEPHSRWGEWVRGCPWPPLVTFVYGGEARLSLWVPVGISAAVGFLAGLLGIGGGFIGLPLLIYLLGLPTRTAVGTSTFQVLIASAYGGLRHIQAGNADLMLVLWMTLGAIAGVILGVKLCTVIAVADTRRSFALLLLAAAALVAWRLYADVAGGANR